MGVMLETQFVSPKKHSQVLVFSAAPVPSSPPGPQRCRADVPVPGWGTVSVNLSAGSRSFTQVFLQFKQELEGVDAVVNQENASILLSQMLQKFSF